MHLLRSLLSLSAALFMVVDGESRTSPPAGAVVVDGSGKNGGYITVQKGLDSLSLTATGTQQLFIYPGVYKEQVYIAPRAAKLIIYGHTQDTSSYVANTVNITYNLSQNSVASNDLTATVRAWATNLKFYNLNIINSFGHTPSKGQALAVSAQAGSQGFYGVGLYGYQDTLLAQTGKQLYAKTKIVGAIDFIFGQRGEAWFEKVDVVTIAAGYITASGRNDTGNPSYFVFNSGTVKGINASVEAQTGIDYLGRPWGEYARVAFQNTYLSTIINSAGWSVWNAPPQERTCCVTFAEYGNTGPGASGSRASFSQKLSAPIKKETILGSDYASQWWVDTSYL